MTTYEDGYPLFEPDIWQEIDCPIAQSDIDLDESQICAAGDRCYCSLCGGHHIAGEDGPNQTVLRLDPCGPMIFRGLPKDAEEKAAWIAEVVQARRAMELRRIQLQNFAIGDI